MRLGPVQCRSLLLWTCLAELGVGQAAAAPRPVVDRYYDCRVIARSIEFPPAPGGASMSASGTVAFVASPSPGIEEIRVGRGDLDVQGVPISRAIARAGGNGTFSGSFPFSRYNLSASINDSGQVAFFGVDENSEEGVWVLSPNHDPRLPSPAYTAPGPFAGVVGSGEINASGVPLFASGFETNPQRSGLFRGPNLLVELTNLGGIGPYVSTRGSGDDYAFEITTGNYPDQLSELFVRNSSVDSVALPGAIVGLSIAGGRVAYTRFDANGDWRLLVTGLLGPPASERVDSTEDAIEADTSPLGRPDTAINGYGDVAFEAIDAERGGRQIFVADGQQIARVLCENGIGVGGGLGPRSFNSDGQIVFGGVLPDAVTLVIARADPIAGLPTSCGALIEGTPCDDDDPETDAICTGGVCIGEGPGRPTSCVGLADATPCDDGDPETFAFCGNAECVAATVPEAGTAGVLIAVATLLARSGNRSRRGLRSVAPCRPRRPRRADR